MRYEIWLSHNAGFQKIQLPVLPEKFTTKSGSNNDSIDLAGLGEIVIMQNRPALQFSFSSFFPANRFPGMKVQYSVPPITLIKIIEQWKNSDKPIRLIATACGLNIYCTIEDFTYYEEGGDPGTYHYSLSLKEYREVSSRQVNFFYGNLTAYVLDIPIRVNNMIRSSQYIVQPGDSLFTISRRLYESPSRYIDIFNANQFSIGANMNLIRPGMILNIP